MTALDINATLAHLESDTHLHVHRENRWLFPAVLDAERALAAGTPPPAARGCQLMTTSTPDSR